MPSDHRIDPAIPRVTERARTRSGPRLRGRLRDAVEIIAAVALATLAVAVLHGSAPTGGLSVLYLPAVMAIAIRRGEIPGLVTAVLSVLTVNYLYIAPRHQFGIAHSQDLVELAVLMLAAVVVSRLAATARQRAAEAERRAELAAARERESALLAEVASSILGGTNLASQLDGIGARIAHAGRATRARLVAGPVPAPAPDEIVLPLTTDRRAVWLYITRDTEFSQEDLARLAGPIGRLIEVALERDRVAEQAAQTEAASQAEQLRTAVLHAISHDLRSPLTAITTAASALRGPVSESEHRELLDVISGEGRRLAKLVDDLLDLSRIEAGAVAPQTDWCDLRDVVSSVLAGVRGEHRVDLELPDDLPLVRADAAQLERVFSNLVENAVRHSPEGQPVVIRAAGVAGRVTVRVIDRGEGIPSSERGRIFEPFFRGRGRRGTGSGLGLAISRGFVEANGGEILLATGQGRGTSFAVTFPAAERPQVVSAGPAGPARSR
jgi:two-component system, OmpR family, sensor histidine kinase KdpD